MEQQINGLLERLQKIKNSEIYSLGLEDKQTILNVETKLQQLENLQNNQKPDLEAVVQIVQLMAILIEMMK